MAKLPQRQVVLLGLGHTNTHIVKMWRMHPLPRAALTCINDFPVATYSGMLPGTLAGQYAPQEMQIDLVRLCAAARARFIQDRVVGLDHDRQLLHFADRPAVRYDALSIGVGSRPVEPPEASIVQVIKPMQTFLARLDAALQQLADTVGSRAWRIAVVGAGAGGMEILFCLPRRLRERFGDPPVEWTLVDRGDEILSDMPAGTITRARRILAERGVQLRLGQEVVGVSERQEILLSDATQVPCDLIVWAVSARPQAILGELGLPTDERGFLATRDTLQSTGADTVFAVGDSGTCLSQPRPKAGVYAVRQAPVLWENLRLLLAEEPLEVWRAQHSFLSLLNTGDGQAILSYHGLATRGAWCWRLKDWIDRRFLEKHRQFEVPVMEAEMDAANLESTSEAMACGGCGCKLPAGALAGVLAGLEIPSSPHVVTGLEAADDVALLLPPAEGLLAVTTDFFTPPLNDPYLVGRIAALNALSDMHAKGCTTHTAQAIVAVPAGSELDQVDFLREVLVGGQRELAAEGVPLVGGHTVVADQPLVGFTLLGASPHYRGGEGNTDGRRAARAGDALILTKPLGTGVLLAAHMRAQCEAQWMQWLLESMLRSNRPAAQAMGELECREATDVTGFGLAGHLLELLDRLGFSARIQLDRLPLLEGVCELFAAGVESTLAPGNRGSENRLVAGESVRRDLRYPILFDPQTSGGLLVVVPPRKVPQFTGALGGRAWEIGEVVTREPHQPAKIEITGCRANRGIA
jgi:selenide,water dikinase